MGDYAVITYKSKYVLEAAHDVRWHETLLDLFCWILDRFGGQTITSAYRPGERGVHGCDPLRGLDLRGKGAKAEKLAAEVNDCWEYDSVRPMKKVALVHNVGSGEHIHLQVHPMTVLIKSKDVECGSKGGRDGFLG